MLDVLKRTGFVVSETRGLSNIFLSVCSLWNWPTVFQTMLNFNIVWKNKVKYYVLCFMPLFLKV